MCQFQKKMQVVDFFETMHMGGFQVQNTVYRHQYNCTNVAVLIFGWLSYTPQHKTGFCSSHQEFHALE